MILVCGGAGYIGSHMVDALLKAGRKVIVLDNLQSGHREAVKAEAVFCRGDVRDQALLDDIMGRGVTAVVHFAASSLVGESMEKPLDYYGNNVHGMEVLLKAMVKSGVGRIIFSSSAAVYGEPDQVPIPENAATRPTNPYGETKLAMEKMIGWAEKAHGLKYTSLRYFNVAGALSDGSLGEDHHPETHLIPLVLQVPLGQREFIGVFGDDYPTPDGTCIRDYVHVGDLAEAHLLALGRLENGGDSAIFNLGSSTGLSVMEIINKAEEVTGQKIPRKIMPRRLGDPARLVADSSLAREILGWRPRFERADDIIATAWAWHSRHPQGFGGHKDKPCTK
ncbi:UDP-glucose 4-epimerase GalE [Deltaproteobacteria bacterium OttesenSCG-928-K17]|nr:UDP-glucose 4-epimerase GalE [Deltaproteobacteria bacterium OttesenSCG-928-K17]